MPKKYNPLAAFGFDDSGVVSENEFSESQKAELLSLIFDHAIGSLGVSPSYIEIGIDKEIVFNWSVTMNDDSFGSAVFSATIDGEAQNNSSISEPSLSSGNQSYSNVSLSANATLKVYDASNVLILNLSKTLLVYIPQWKGYTANATVFTSYADIELETNLSKLLQSSSVSNMSIAVPSGKYGVFISKTNNLTIRELVTGLALSENAYSIIEIELTNGSATFTVYQYTINPATAEFSYYLQ